MSDSLRPHESQHARPPCPSPTPRVQLRLTSIESVMPSSHLILCRPLFLLPPIPPSIRVFSSESTLCMRWPKYWSFSFRIIPSKEHPGLISFRISRGKRSSMPQPKTRPDSPVPSLQGPCEGLHPSNRTEQHQFSSQEDLHLVLRHLSLTGSRIHPYSNCLLGGNKSPLEMISSSTACTTFHCQYKVFS